VILQKQIINGLYQVNYQLETNKRLYNNTVMGKPELYPLILSPTVKNYIWGGKKLLKLADPADSRAVEPVAEIWAIFGENKIKNGAYFGYTLNQLTQKEPVALLGHSFGQSAIQDFPILIKVLDCHQWLSIQVHPDDALALELEGAGQKGKTEAWFFLEANPQAMIYAGTKPEIDSSTLSDAIQNNKIMDVIQPHEIKTQDFIFIQAGTIHALGPGLTVYELQQSSDLTYRVYDWERPAQAGRPLHIEKSCLSAKTIQATPKHLQPKAKSNSYLVLAQCPYFTLDLINNSSGAVNIQTQLENCHALTVASGELNVLVKGSSFTLRTYESLLIPACVGEYQLSGEFSVLRASPKNSPL
jgi:mannose-6-phosphate isomerase